MTVGDLIDVLGGLDEDMVVVLARDGTGSELSFVDELKVGRMRSLTEFICEEDEEDTTDAISCVAVFPDC